MPGTALWVDGFICLPLSGTALWALFPFICLPLSPSLDVWHGSPGGQIHLSPFDSLVSLCLPSFVSRCLPALMPGTSLSHLCHGSPGGRIHLSPLVPLHLSPISVGGRIDLSPFVSLYLSLCVDGFICLPLSLFVSRCLPAWMPLWVDGFICLPLSPSLDVWHSRSAVSFTSRGSVLLAGSGLPSASALASVIPCLVDVGDRVLCLPFIWTSILLGLVAGRLPCLSLATPCLFVQCLVISCGLSLSLLAFGVPS